MIEYGLSVGSKCNSLKTNQAILKRQTGMSTCYSLTHLTPPPTRYVLGRCPLIKDLISTSGAHYSYPRAIRIFKMVNVGFFH